MLSEAASSGGETAPRLALLVEYPSGEPRRVPVTRNPFVIGRLRTCHLPLGDSRISRRHARICEERGAYFIEDLGSRHGIAVNGVPTRRSRLAEGDWFEFGFEESCRITVCGGSDPQALLLKKVARLPSRPGRTAPLERLAAMVEVARTIESSDGLGEVFKAALEASLRVTGAERAFLLLRTKEGALDVEMSLDSAGGSPALERLEPQLDALAQALDSRREVFAMPVGMPVPERGTDGSDTNDDLDQTRSVCMPILHTRIGRDHPTRIATARADSCGAVYLETRRLGAGLEDTSQALLQALAIQISAVIENARLIREERLKRRMEDDLREARAIQRSLLPRDMPSEGWLVGKALCEPAGYMNGDFCELTQVAPDKWAGFVADVCGKRLPASLLAVLLQGAFSLGAGPDVRLAGTLTRINRYLCDRSQAAKYATVFALTVTADGEMRWSNAGHVPAVLVRAAGGLEWLESNGPLVGAFRESEFQEASLRLHPGDKLLVYTDGVSELRNGSGEEFGTARLQAAAEEFAHLEAAPFLDAVVGRLHEFGGAGSTADDDLTLLSLGYGLPA